LVHEEPRKLTCSLIISHVSPTNGWVSIQADLIITFIIWAIGFAGLIAATHLFPIYLGG